MVLNLHLRRALRAALLIAACLLAPAMANAHSGHSHAPVTAQAAAAPDVVADHANAAAKPDILSEVVSATPIWTNGVASGCASHCCGGLGGMTCCSAALTPDISAAPDFSGVYCLILTRSGPLPGLVPEALPKPPKSFG